MKRRDFIKTSAAIAASLGLPAGAIAAVTRLPTADGLPIHERAPATKTTVPEVLTAGTVTRLRVGLHHSSDVRHANRIAREAGYPQPQPDPPDDENNYWAEAIEDGDQFYYRVDGTTVEITQDEFLKVVCNPSLYYFTSALKLHYRIKRTKERQVIPA